MLVLGRKMGETIVIDDVIRIVVVEVKGNQVRLGVIAPSDIPVDRKEIYDRRIREWGLANDSKPVALA